MICFVTTTGQTLTKSVKGTQATCEREEELMGKPAAVATASLMCSFGLAPSTLNVIPIKRVLIEGKPAATITDIMPGANIPPFGMCTSWPTRLSRRPPRRRSAC